MSKINKSTLLVAFNKVFVEFVEDIQRVFPKDVDVLTAKNSLLLAKKTNPRMIIEFWMSLVVNKYANEIAEGNIEFFINKDYNEDIKDAGTDISESNKIMEAIDRLRQPIKSMTEEDQTTAMKYIQQLTQVAQLYYQ